VPTPAVPPQCAPRMADQHSPEDEDDEEETEEETEEEDDEEQDDEDQGEEDQDDEDQDDDHEIADDRDSEDGVPGRPDSSAARQLLSEAQTQSDAAVSAPGHEAHSQNALKAPGMCTPTDLEPRSGDLASTEGVISPQDSGHGRINREEHGRRVESTGPLHPFVPIPERGAPSDLMPTAPTQMAPMTLAAHSPVPGDIEQDGMIGALSERQFFVDFHLGCEEILAESRASKLLRTGGPAGKGPLSPSEIAHRALSLSIGFQSNEGPRQLEEPFWSGRTPVSPSPSAALHMDKRSKQQVQTPPLPSPTSLPPPPAVVYHQLEQQSPPLRVATSPQMPIPAPAAIVEARNTDQVQRPDPNQPHHGLKPLPTIDPHRGQDESFPSHHYSLKPPPAVPGPLPASTPRLVFPAPQQTGGLPPFAQLVQNLFNPMRVAVVRASRSGDDAAFGGSDG
jgi:hypothetical protein